MDQKADGNESDRMAQVSGEVGKKECEYAGRYYQRNGLLQTNDIVAEGLMIPAVWNDDTACAQNDTERKDRQSAAIGHRALCRLTDPEKLSTCVVENRLHSSNHIDFEIWIQMISKFLYILN